MMDVSDGKPRSRLIVSLPFISYIRQYACVQGSPNLDVAAAIDPCPDTEYVLAAPDAQDCSANLFACFGKLVADHRKQQILPVAIRYTLLETNDPLASLPVFFVLPDRSDAFLEDVII